MNRLFLSVLLTALVVHFPLAWHCQGANFKPAAIVIPEQASLAENLAAAEVRRYVYLRTGRLMAIRSEKNVGTGGQTLLLVGRNNRRMISAVPGVGHTAQALPAQGYLLKTVSSKTVGKLGPFPHRDLILVVGGDDAGTLYAAYRLAETLGVRFYLHGDVLPDDKLPFALPVLDECSTPLFAIRGIQPFHDFPEGPDWWNRDDYFAVIGQLPKLRMNFIGLHTYPENRPNAEPTVWIGPEADIGNGGKVKSSYSASYQNTVRGNWGYTAKKTADYAFGSSALFERDAFGPDVMLGHLPAPKTAPDCNAVFEEAAAMLRDAFGFAHLVGVKTCVGTETPLVVPKEVQDRLSAAGKNPGELRTVEELYTGIFRRAAAAYPLDYYWLWTPEGWTWSGTKDEEVRATTNDLWAAISAHKTVRPPFALATCGWVLGPQQDRALFDKILPKNLAVSCINREVGKTPVEPGFAQVQGRSKWAIPWMEDDPALTSPQLWVGRMRRDAADALRYGCDGLLGIHWRTRVLAPNVASLALAAWTQEPWVGPYKAALPSPDTARKPGPTGGSSAAFPDNPIAGTEDPTLYQTVRYNLSAYRLPASNGTCHVVLKFCEPHYGEAGKRVFDVMLQGAPVITNLDIFARVGKNRALDFSFEGVVVTNGWVDIDFLPRIEFPSIAAIDIQGDGFKTKVNCGGPAYRDYAADAPNSEPIPQVYAQTSDFYLDWTTHEFGPEVGVRAASIFSRIDCNLPVPSVWTDGPGGIQPDTRPWEQVRSAYAFVDSFAELREQVRGPGNLDRFDYWLNTFEYLRAIGQVNCAWAEYNRAIEKVKANKDPAGRKALAHQIAVPARRNLVRFTAALYSHLLATVSTPGELGTVANWEQHNLPALLEKPGDELAKILEMPLPSDLQPQHEYDGPTRIIVPTRPGLLASDTDLKLKIIILSEQPPRSAALFSRRLGTGSFVRSPLHHVARGVYSADLRANHAGDLEYYIKVEPRTGKPVLFPPTAPALNQTIVFYSTSSLASLGQQH